MLRSSLRVAEDEVMEEAGNKVPTPQQITAIKAAIQNAQTMKEVQELEAALVTGHIPSEVKVSTLSNISVTECQNISRPDSLFAHFFQLFLIILDFTLVTFSTGEILP